MYICPVHFSQQLRQGSFLPGGRRGNEFPFDDRKIDEGAFFNLDLSGEGLGDA